MGFFATFAYFAFGRAILARIVPSPGTGPSEEARLASWFRVQFTCETVAGPRLLGVVAGGDPGYTETAKMVSNAALCLIDTSSLSAQGGVLTSASSMGASLIKRLQEAGMTFEVESMV